jgi:hypothetical protein
MLRARPVAGLAADRDIGERRREAVGRRVVALVDRRRVACRAHRVPGLVAAGPRQLGGLDREPRTPLGIPRQPECLEPAARLLDQVLLQRRATECVADVEPLRGAGLARDVDDVGVAVAAGPRSVDNGAREVTGDAGRRCFGHRARVVRAAPARDLAGVAPQAQRRLDVARRLDVERRRRRCSAGLASGERCGRDHDRAAREARRQHRRVTDTPRRWRRRTE